MELLLTRSGREDLNLRPQRPERCALTGLRYSPRAHGRIAQKSGSRRAGAMRWLVVPVPEEGLEPPTPALGRRRSIH